MNFNTYSSYYGKFHKCTESSIRQNIIVFNLGTSKYETWFVTRMHPYENVYIDCQKTLLLALKTFFKSDVPASVVCNRHYQWTACLGNERIIYPIGKEVHKNEESLKLYATPFFVTSVSVVNQYLQGTIRPAYENVFFYKNTILYLDNEDLPYPGGSYFDPCQPTPYYRMCFLSNEPEERVIDIALEWESRQDVMVKHFVSREIACIPKFIHFEPVSDHGFTDVTSTGIIHKVLSSKKPEHLIQDVLNSYYTNVARRALDESHLSTSFNGLGLFIEWPFLLTFEGGQYSESANKTFVALSINGTHPSRVLYVSRPYERYTEHTNVPATLWTPVAFSLSTLLTDPGIRKVAIDSTVVGLVYRETFFCFSQPLLEGVPTQKAIVDGQYLLSTVTFDLKEDANVRVIETFRYNDKYSLQRVGLKNVSLDTWCLTQASESDPYPKTIKLPDLVRQWTDFFMQVGEDTFDMDVSAVRLALMLSKHNICFNLNAVQQQQQQQQKNLPPREALDVSDNAVNFYLDEKIVQFLNNVRMITTDKEAMETVAEEGCRLS